MTLVLDPTTEARLQRELATGRYTGPSELLTHALDLLEAERDDLAAHQADFQADHDEGFSEDQRRALMAQRRAEMLAEIRESVAQLDRGEFVTKEQLRDRIEARREASLGRQAA